MDVQIVKPAVREGVQDRLPIHGALKGAFWMALRGDVMARRCVSSTMMLFVGLIPAQAPKNIWRPTSPASQQFVSLHVRALRHICFVLRGRLYLSMGLSMDAVTRPPAPTDDLPLRFRMSPVPASLATLYFLINVMGKTTAPSVLPTQCLETAVLAHTSTWRWHTFVNILWTLQRSLQRKYTQNESCSKHVLNDI